MIPAHGWRYRNVSSIEPCKRRNAETVCYLSDSITLRTSDRLSSPYHKIISTCFASVHPHNKPLLDYSIQCTSLKIRAAISMGIRVKPLPVLVLEPVVSTLAPHGFRTANVVEVLSSMLTAYQCGPARLYSEAQLQVCVADFRRCRQTHVKLC